MGAPHWSKEERSYFLNVVLPNSRYATGTHSENSGQSFAELATRMQEDLDKLQQSRRTYTEDILFQHWYQKVRNSSTVNRISGAHAPSMPGTATPIDQNHSYSSVAPEQSGDDSADEKADSLRPENSPSLTVEPTTTASLTESIPTVSNDSLATQTKNVTARSSTPNSNNKAELKVSTLQNNRTASNMASPPYVILSDEDAPLNNKRPIGATDESDEKATFAQNTAKKLKTEETDLEYSDYEPSLTPEPKKTRGRATNTVAAEKKFADVDYGDDEGSSPVIIPTKRRQDTAIHKRLKENWAGISPFIGNNGQPMSEASMRKHGVGPYAPGGAKDPNLKKECGASKAPQGQVRGDSLWFARPGPASVHQYKVEDCSDDKQYRNSFRLRHLEKYPSSRPYGELEFGGGGSRHYPESSYGGYGQRAMYGRSHSDLQPRHRSHNNDAPPYRPSTYRQDPLNHSRSSPPRSPPQHGSYRLKPSSHTPPRLSSQRNPHSLDSISHMFPPLSSISRPRSTGLFSRMLLRTSPQHGSRLMSPDSYALDPNAPVSNPRIHSPDQSSGTARRSSSPPGEPAFLTPKVAGEGAEAAVSAIATSSSLQLNVPTHRSISPSSPDAVPSNDQTTQDRESPRKLGAVYTTTGHAMMVSECPCCKRGF